MEIRSSALSLLEQNKRWQTPHLRVQLSALPGDPRALTPTP